VVVLDTGQNMLWGMQGVDTRDRMRMWTAGGMSPMGYSFPAALGAVVAGAKGQVICVIGDGGMQINIQELETLRRYDLPVKTFVMNNKSLGLIRQFQDDYLDSRHEASRSLRDYFRPDFPRIAAGYGVPSCEINNPADIDGAIGQALECDGPFLCNVSLLPTEDVLYKAIMGRPIEDQHPLLPREELFENLLFDYNKKDYE
jgi:acetolactate synthase-1/2/3 large subunit